MVIGVSYDIVNLQQKTLEMRGARGFLGKLVNLLTSVPISRRTDHGERTQELLREQGPPLNR
jgi:hypothetical protein